MLSTFRRLGCAAVALSLSAARLVAAPFEIQVVDEATGRGVPLVELETVDHERFVTDSAGRVAFDEPGLMGREIFFHVRSHGYEFPKDGFGFRGARIATSAGGATTLKIKRLNIAERLYRITGAGIYRDTLLLGKKAPLAEPALNAEVLGQDSVQTAIYRGKIFWLWGDTLRASYPLGHFRTAGAWSKLPADGGLDPSVGIDLKYFTDSSGFSRPICPLDPAQPGPVWLFGLCVVPDENGAERLVSHFSRRKNLAEQVEQGIAVWSDEKEIFEPVKPLPLTERWRFPRGNSLSSGGYIYFADPFPNVRVRATLADATNPASYETWSAERGWTRDGERESAKAAVDVESGKPIKLQAGSVHWNAFRQRWIMIAVQEGGQSSHLGEVFYLESRELAGPWLKARKIVTHDRYTFYNPSHHDFFDAEGGRFIFFEGTYAETFSGNPIATPRYDYNQVMYRLDLADPRLAGAQVE